MQLLAVFRAQAVCTRSRVALSLRDPVSYRLSRRLKPRASSPGVRPDRTSPTICCRSAALYGGLDFGIADTSSSPRKQESTKSTPGWLAGRPWATGYALARHVRQVLALDRALLPTTAELARALGEDPQALTTTTRSSNFKAGDLVNGVVTSDDNGHPAFAIHHG